MPLLSVLKLRLLVFLTVFAGAAFANAYALELEGGWQNIAITENMVGKSFSQDQLKGDCDVQKALVYDTKATEGQWIMLQWQDDSRTITDEMVGYGLWIYTPENTRCNLQAKGYAENLGKASGLSSGWNFISVSKGMVGKSLAEQPLKGTCSIEKVWLYSPKACETTGAAEEQGSCVGDYAIIDPAAKLTDFYLGKGIWVKAASECTLDDGTPAEVLCKESECAAKSGCDGTSYRTYSCQNKECTLLSTRGCTADEKAEVEGVNLVPELVINPSRGLKGGDTIEVTLYVKNAGTRNAHYSEIKGGGTGIYNLVYFYKDEEYGQEVIPYVYAPVSLLLLPGGAIKPGDSGKVQVAKQPVRIPEDFSGSLVIVAAVDTQSIYPETDEKDNRPAKTITVRALTPPNLVPIEAEAFPTLESLPVVVSHVNIAVKNTGERKAIAEGNVGSWSLLTEVSILKGNVNVCKGKMWETVDESGIKPNEIRRMAASLSSTSNEQCRLDDKSANYWAVVDVDTLQVGTAGTAKGVVAESDEKDNKKTFQLKGPQECPALGAVEAGRYCSIAAGTWLTQIEAGQRCSHNFECKTELCIKNKCVTEAQKEQILKIVG